MTTTRAPVRAGTRPFSVLIVAANETLAATIEARLRGHDEWRLTVGVASRLAALVEQHRPHVIVLVEALPRLIRALEIVRHHPQRPSVVLLLADPHGAWTRETRRAGVRAVMPVDATAEELTAALRAVSHGLVVLHPDALNVASRVAPADVQVHGDLTAREMEIVEMMAEGLSNRVIAGRLGISGHTVKFHVASILAKLRASSRTEAVMVAVRRGLVPV
jgi:DNA-binding NarL/FixJ family response regulator